MKETELPQKDQVQIVKQVQQKKTLSSLGDLVPGDGHKIYEFDKRSYELREVKAIENKTYNHNPSAPGTIKGPQDSQKKKYEGKPYCHYISALNEGSAVKKICKLFKHIPCVVVMKNDE